MDTLKWGIIGSAKRAQTFASELSYTLKPQILHAYLPLHEGDAAATSNLQIPNLFSSVKEMLQSDIDALYIAAPHEKHYKLVKKSLKQGKPVLCERPISESVEQLKKLKKLSKKNKTFMMEAMWIRFLPLIKKVIAVNSNDSLGDVVSVKASVHYKNIDNVRTSDIGGGALIELGTYPVFLSTLFLGKPSYIKATGHSNPSGEDESFSALLSYADGQYAVIEASKITKGDSEAVIGYENGVIKIKNPWSIKPEGVEVDFLDGTKKLHRSEWKGTGLHFELDEVYECLQKNLTESPLYSHRFHMDVVRTMDEIRHQLS